MSAPELWIVIARWDGPEGFQHYKDRDPKWIKVYTRLMSDDAYLSLTGNRRAILHGLWLEYAMSNRCLALDIKMIARRLALNVKMSDIEALNHAGFLRFSASKPLATRYQAASPEKEAYREEAEEQDQEHDVKSEKQDLRNVVTEARPDDDDEPIFEHAETNGLTPLDYTAALPRSPA